MATNNSRARGHKWELDCIKLLKDLKIVVTEFLVSSRSESRSRDNQKVDLINVDEGTNGRFILNVQAKNYSTKLKYDEVLAEMPQDGDQINVIFNKYTKKSGKNFMTQGHYAILDLDDFLTIFKKAYDKDNTDI